MSFSQIIQHLYLPLLTQETAVMISAFTYGLKAGAGAALLVAVNTAAVITDLILFFLPTYSFAERLHELLRSRFQDRYDTGVRFVARFGAFRASTAMGFVMPSVAAMIIVGALRLSFWRSMAGLFVGSAIYVVVPLLIAEPLAPILPRFLIPILPWIAPSIAIFFIALGVLRLLWKR
jgi:hypothetical protein